MSSSFAVFMLFMSICLVLHLSLRVLALSLCLLILLPIPFIRDLISQASSSSSSSSHSRPSSSSSRSLRPSSSYRAHSVHRVVVSVASARNGPLSSIRETATWGSASVFTSFYLSDIQFSSDQGFSLGPVVAAGSVV